LHSLNPIHLRNLSTMKELFNLETFRIKVKSVLNNKNHVETNQYTLQLEELLHEVLLGSAQFDKPEKEQNPEKSENYKEMYQLLRLMCDNVPDMIWAKNLDNEYIFANKAISEGLLIASDTSEPIGKTDMFFAQRARQLHPENPEWHTFGEICRDTDTIILQNKEPQRFNEYGNIKGRFLYLDVIKAPFYDSEGNIIGTVGSGRDVTHEHQLQTEHDQALVALKTQTARLDAVVSVLPDL